MLARTHRDFAPWTVVRADDKRRARLDVIRDLLSRLEYRDKDQGLVVPDRGIVFDYSDRRRHEGKIAD
jgi:hypothetical protein